MPKPARVLAAAGAAALVLALAGPARTQTPDGVPRTLLPWTVMRDIVQESSGEVAFQNLVRLAGVNRNRRPEEYQKGYFETAFLLEKLKEYGMDEASVVELPSREKTAWDAESAELWITEPDKRKLCDLDELPACLCSGSAPTDATGELVYVGPGSRESDYKDKAVQGKILLVNGYPGGAVRLGVEKYGAAGVVAWAGSHQEYDRDEVGWGGIDRGAGEKAKPAFGFMVSQRQGQDLRDALERGQKIVLRAVVKASRVPAREEMTVGLIKGKELPDQELVFTAHVFEGLAKQGANDDLSGCAAILETARTLKALIADGAVPPLKRSVRFLFVPEISGTAAYIKKYPEISKRFFADINHDMVGEGLVKNLSATRLEVTPWSIPSYLNDVVTSFVEWMGTTQRDSQENGWRSMAVLSPAGSRDPFYYSIDPYSGGSDHLVFVDGAVRVPAVMFIVWPDMWYHTSGDTVDKADSTQLKRVVALSVASAVFLANAGPEQAEAVMAEVAARGAGRLGTARARAEGLLLEAAAKDLPAALRESRNLVVQSYERERTALASTRFFFAGDKWLEVGLKDRLSRLDALRATDLKDLSAAYERRCERLKVKAAEPAPSPEELRLAKIVPSRTAKIADVESLWGLGAELRKIMYEPTEAIGRAEFELRNFVDGTRTALEVRDAASAEHGPIPMADMEAWLKAMEKVGALTLRKK